MTEFTAYHVPASDEEPTKITRTEPFTLDEMQDYVGGYVEGVFSMPDTDWVMVINEEGYRLGLPPNRRITGQLNQRVVGDVLIMQKELYD